MRSISILQANVCCTHCLKKNHRSSYSKVFIMMIIRFLFLIFCISCTIGNTTFNNSINRIPRVVSNDKVKPGEFAYTVSILWNDEPHCTGSIYKQRYIITAATCVEGLNPEDLVILAGTLKLYEGGAYYQVDRIISKKPFGKNNLNDNIAMLRTKRRIQKSNEVRSCRLPEADLPADVEEQLVSVGSGAKVSKAK